MALRPTTTTIPGDRRTFSPDAWPCKKTVDIGQNGVTVSADPYGGIYQISAPIANPAFAMLIAAPWGQFDQKDRTNPAAVREYRKVMEKRLQRRQPGLGLGIGVKKGPVTVRHGLDCLGARVLMQYQSEECGLAVQTILEVRDDGMIVQAMQITNAGSQACEVPVVLDLSFAVSRASYGQLTDQGEVPMPEATNVVSVTKMETGARKVTIDNESLGGRLSAIVLSFNNSTKFFTNLDECLFPAPCLDHNPPQMLLDDTTRQPRKQTIRIKAGESVRLACMLRTEDIIPEDDEKSQASGFDAESMIAGLAFDHVEMVSLGMRIRARNIRGEHDFCQGETVESSIFWANLNYIIGCCAAPLERREEAPWAVIPDHIALPLGWPRDNYWQLRLLMKMQEIDGFTKLFHRRPDSAQLYSRVTKRVLRGHLDWLFNVAKTNVQIGSETRHFWRRSYLINGRPKDGMVYQLDTQLYPFLQLCDYSKLANAPACATFVNNMVRTDTFCKVLLDALKQQDPETGLFKTDETPADDDTSDFPFHTSSNILLWYTLWQISDLLRNSGICVDEISPSRLEAAADKVYDGIQTYLICECNDGSGQRMFAYALDPSKPTSDPHRHRRYHDGNDMPTLFAHEWGFLTHSKAVIDLPAVWHNTLTWAFTPDPAWTPDPRNRRQTPGFNTGYAGNGRELFHGLGSDHSDGAWVLGLFQEWKYARIVGNAKRERSAWGRIKGAMQWDGTFSEAVDVRDGRCSSKTWFSWPGAMIATELVGTLVEKEKTAERGCCCM